MSPLPSQYQAWVLVGMGQPPPPSTAPYHLGALLHAKLLRQAQACTPREALTLARESLSIRQYLYGPKDQSVAASYGNIAILQIACGKHEEALGSLDQCMAIRQIEAKKGAANVSYTYLYYGWCYTMMDQHFTANNCPISDHYPSTGMIISINSPLNDLILGDYHMMLRRSGFWEHRHTLNCMWKVRRGPNEKEGVIGCTSLVMY